MSDSGSISNDRSNFRRFLHQLISFALIGCLIALWSVSTAILYFTWADTNSAINGKAVVVGAVLGVYLSRWCIVSAMIVLLPGKAYFRVLLGSMTFVGEVILLAMLLADSNLPTQFLTLPLIVFALAIPFEFARVFRRARIHVDWFDVLEPPRLGLRELFFRMTCFAVLLAILQAYDREVLLELLGLVVGMTALSSIFILPYTVLLTRIRYRFLFLWGFIGVVVGCMFLIGLLLLVTQVVDRATAIDVMMFLPLFSASLLVSYALAWLVLERLGCKFQMGDQKLFQSTQQ